jgi:signal transduction histidine kinase
MSLLGRMRPDTIAARLAFLIGAGVLLALGASVAVLWVGVLSPDYSMPYPRMVARIATVVHMLDRAPAHVRERLLTADSQGDSPLRLRLVAGEAGQAVGQPHWTSRRLAEDLRKSARRRGLVVVPAPASTRAQPAIRVELRDGSWVEIAADRGAFGGAWLVRFLLALLVLAGGVVLVAWWVARRATAPLAAFAGAATRLGLDVHAPPIAMEGPREIREASAAFNAMQARIQRFVDDRTRTLAAISHDLRTALTRLHLRTEYIADAHQRARAESDLDEMERMLEATLSYARDDVTREPRTPLDLARLLQTLVDDLADAGQPVEYEGPERHSMQGRPAALRRAFANLIDNAIRYGSSARVRLVPVGDDVIVEVIDRGPGIAPEFREEVFRPFYRLEGSRSRDTGGSGLGLSLARGVARAHGGDIELGDGEDGALVARVRLPGGGEGG